jgi:hypothetical protein
MENVTHWNLLTIIGINVMENVSIRTLFARDAVILTDFHVMENVLIKELRVRENVITKCV